MNPVFKIRDKNGKEITLSNKGWKHIQKHPYMHERLEDIKLTLTNPLSIRYFNDNKTILNFYKEYKEMSTTERYLLVSVKYLNGDGVVITAFFTNRITGLKWNKE